MRANCVAKVAKVASYFRHAGSISLERGGAERPLRGDRAMCPSCRRHLSAERAERRDPSRVTEQRVRHAGSISLGSAVEQRDSYGVTEPRGLSGAPRRAGISLLLLGASGSMC